MGCGISKGGPAGGIYEPQAPPELTPSTSEAPAPPPELVKRASNTPSPSEAVVKPEQIQQQGEVVELWKKTSDDGKRRRSLEPAQNPPEAEDTLSELRPAVKLPPVVPQARVKAKLAWKKVSGMSSVIKDGLVRIKADQMMQDFTKSIGIVEAFGDRLPRGCNKNMMEGVEALTEAECFELVHSTIADELATCLWKAVTKLQGERRQKEAQELSRSQSAMNVFLDDNEKFAEASYGDIDVFFQGLDGRIGLPSTRPMEGMMDEHLNQADSEDEFVTANYGGTKTCPATEWEMVHHPQEGKAYPGTHRTASPLGNFLMKPEAKSAGLTIVEVCALRLYTGPMYMKYNAVLRRGPDEKVEALKGNTYTTTLHAICSGVIKLSRVWSIPASRRVFRGVSGLVLPPNFWSPDAHGCCGGVELGLMSTTTKREIATHYSNSKEGMIATIIEVEVGQIDRGASLTFLSQYPGEEEVLLPPLSNLEVVGKPRMEHSGVGTTVVIPCRINCNLKTLTMDELVGRRKQQMVAMQRNLMQETRQTLLSETPNSDWRADVSIDYMLEPFRLLLYETEETLADKFNDDGTFRDSVNRSLNLKVGTEKKWRLLHDSDVASAPELRERVMKSHAGRFAEDGFIYELRSGTDQVPFSAMIAGELDVIAVPSLTPVQAAVMWECVLKHCKDVKVAVVAAGGHGQVLVRASEILTAESVTVSGRKIDPGQIRTMSSGHRFNRKLLTLSITNCYIRDIGCTALAENLQHCPWLRGLDLGENGIGASGCEALSETVGKACTGLTALRLAWNIIGVEGYKGLSGLLQQCGGLKSIDLSFTMPNGECMQIFNSSLTTTSLTNLEFAVSPLLGNLGMIAAGEVASRNTNLTRLDVSRANCTTGLAVFLRHLAPLKQLVSLSLCEVADALNTPEISELVSGVIARSPNLRSIVISHMNPVVAASIESCKDTIVRIFTTGDWPSDPGGLTLLAKGLTGPQLRHFIDGGMIGYTFDRSKNEPVLGEPRPSFNITSLLEAASEGGCRLNPDIQTISIGENDLSRTEHMKKLQDFASQCIKLNVLSLRTCGITTEGGGSLRNIIAANCASLVTLDLSWNKLTAAWVDDCLSPVLPQCHVLKELNLSHNDLREVGFIASVQAVIKGATSLVTLDISRNGVLPIIQGANPGVINAVMQLQALTSLRTLKFLDFHWSEQTTDRLSRCLASIDPSFEIQTTGVTRGS